jgi:biofilm PGA synthesis protein PgaA
MQRLLVIVLAIIVCIARVAHAAERADTAALEEGTALYRSAIDDARSGRVAQAAAALRSLVDRFPARQDMLGDYAVVLGWNGEHAAALSQLDRIERAAAPAYVIEAIAWSARVLRQFDLSATLYRETMLRFPERVEPQVGLVRTLLDAGKLDEATTLAAALRAKYPRRLDVLEAFADVAIARRDYFAALTAYQEMLEQDSTHRGALRGKVLVLARIGAPQLAIELADRHPGTLPPAEREAIAADRTARQIRWGKIAADNGHGPARFAALDLALAESEAAGARALDPAAALSATERQLALDRVSALETRYRMREACELYEALAARSDPVPAYAQGAAAGAYLYREQPEKARDLYRAALVADPDNLEYGIGLFYALADGEEHAAALAQIERMVAATPQSIGQWSALTTRENPAYARVLAARAMAPLFANQPGDTEQRLHELSARAPFNLGIRTDYASAMRARGWPRAAEEELRWVLAIDPQYSEALGERTGALLEMHDFGRVKAALAAAQASAAEDGRVVRAARLVEVHGLRELIVDGTYGRSRGGGPTGTHDYGVDSRLYSSPINDSYRFFAHAYNAQAKFDEGSVRRDRVGAGVEFRSSLITATGELTHDLNQGRTGAAVSLAYTPDDHWTLRATADSSANETPLQARLDGVRAWRASAEALWQAHESRSAALGYAHMNFSDGNRRHQAMARWTERVVKGPVYKLEITGALYASRNSLADTAYFNPSKDFSPTVEFANEWLQWRRYTRAFRHRVVVSAGSYWQQHFGTKPVWGARYEQEWTADDRLTLRYGLGRTKHPYDGDQTSHNYGYASLNWKF